MPIIVREIVVKATIGKGGKAGDMLGLGKLGGKSNEDAIVARCVEQVSRILKESKRR